jgi:hypothetical protein
VLKFGATAAVRFIIKGLPLAWCIRHLSLVTKPDRSGSGSSPEGTESGTEDRQKNWTAHFQKTTVIVRNKSFRGTAPARMVNFKDPSLRSG